MGNVAAEDKEFTTESTEDTERKVEKRNPGALI
jgi:hypothetical protein